MAERARQARSSTDAHHIQIVTLLHGMSLFLKPAHNVKAHFLLKKVNRQLSIVQKRAADLVKLKQNLNNMVI